MSHDQFAKLAPFARRSGTAITGRERLARLRKKLEFILVTEDLTENSRRKLTSVFSCPIVTYLTSADVERLFGFRGTKVVGFTKSPLARTLLTALRADDNGSGTT